MQHISESHVKKGFIDNRIAGDALRIIKEFLAGVPALEEMSHYPFSRWFFWLFECRHLFLDRLTHKSLVPLNLKLAFRRCASDTKITPTNKEEEDVYCRHIVRDQTDPVLFQSLFVLCTETSGPFLFKYDKWEVLDKDKEYFQRLTFMEAHRFEV